MVGGEGANRLLGSFSRLIGFLYRLAELEVGVPVGVLRHGAGTRAGRRDRRQLDISLGHFVGNILPERCRSPLSQVCVRALPLTALPPHGVCKRGMLHGDLSSEELAGEGVPAGDLSMSMLMSSDPTQSKASRRK